MVEHWIWLPNLRWEVLCLFIWPEGGTRWGLQGRRGGSGKYFGFSCKWLKCGRKGSGYTYFGIFFSVNTCGWIVEYIFIAGKFQLRNLGVHFDQTKTFQARCEPVLWFCLFVPPHSLSLCASSFCLVVLLNYFHQPRKHNLSITSPTTVSHGPKVWGKPWIWI